MGIDRILDISSSAIEAERLQMELISSNIANANTTRTEDGGPYTRKVAVLEEKPLTFQDALAAAEEKLYGGGVRVAEVVRDTSPYQKVYKPDHPDADINGFVELPNVDLSREMVDMVEVSKLYEANITVFNASKKMLQDTLTLNP
ncbi:MAG: flagellar basal body rod protein FlgC [Candidatus Margulisiibacteriota bacterium]|nr:flagellar basal body rod protein FlgC [Candidatus Margulisiibacteriota bacterium]